MNQPNRAATPDPKELAPGQLAPIPTGCEAIGVEQLALRLDLQSMPVLLTVLANVARLGCGLHHVAAANAQAQVVLLAPARIAHRVESCLAQIIGVLSVSVTSVSEQ